jgi:RNA polymerase sigma-70 factor (ECF subfamily)
MLWLEQEILKGIRNGDRSIFDSVFKEFYSKLCAFAKDYVKSNDIAQELVQEVFFNLWESHSKIHIKSSLKAYLYRSVHNHCLNYIRQINTRARNLQIEQIDEWSDLLSLELREDVFDEIFTEKVEFELEKAIASLPEQCGNIFRLCRYENLSYPEIAKQLDISLSNVKTQMSRAMNKLRECMDKYL